MRRVVLTPAAREDMLAIVVFIAMESQSNADRVTDRIDAKLRLLACLPKAGRPRPELGEGVRSIAAFRFIVFYRAEASAVRILRVLHGSQDVHADDL